MTCWWCDDGGADGKSGGESVAPEGLSETEALLALLALGEPLEWMRYENGAYAEEEARTEACDYLVKVFTTQTASRDFLTCIVCHGHRPRFMRVGGLPAYASIAEAKAVCERHRATGQWE